MSESLRTTPFKEFQEQSGARFVPFGGWSLPVAFSSILDEYWTVRRQCGLFDVSHMGRFIFQGKDSGAFLDYLLTQSISTLSLGQGRYCLLCREDGGILDDAICYRMEQDTFLLVVNGATREKDWLWIEKHLEGRWDLRVQDTTLQTAMLALQGPHSRGVLGKVFAGLQLTHHVDDGENFLKKKFQLLQVAEGNPLPLLVSSTGYTGEDGFEIFGPSDFMRSFWKVLLENGAQPVGLGARDILRLEMGYLLYGTDATEDNDPFEAGLGWTVKISKEQDFIGKKSLVEKKKTGPAKVLVGLSVQGRKIPRAGCAVLQDSDIMDSDILKNNIAGQVTSGGFSPWLNRPIALAYLNGFRGNWDQKVRLSIRGEEIPAQVVKPPFIDRKQSPAAEPGGKRNL